LVSPLDQTQLHIFQFYCKHHLQPKLSSLHFDKYFFSLSLKNHKLHFISHLSYNKSHVHQPFKILPNQFFNFIMLSTNFQIRKSSDCFDCRNKWSIDPDKISLFITKKNTKNTFRLYFEFTDPSNNLTLMRFFPGINPFTLFDFAANIPNPGKREKARTDNVYKKRYVPYNNRR